ncbi:protein translocase subunit SecD [Haematospirillum sp. 15-248]|uniref:protein translocase subunit SecD n=1 Tax=Haematospirillum sp. 15-248 TaxID=2723107 RepID=UPI00143A21B7|nr:protein translocase subunit SecD [Haematospirillum sp. 15-248]NKD87651.1 protein translocase subunit SecD [Haematospirillum sp. 15-248]
MLYFSKIKTTLVITICLVGILLGLPNLIPEQDMPSWMPDTRINLGLDLRGGSYLMLKVDLDTLSQERVEGTVDSTRNLLRDARIRYTGLGVDGGTVRFDLVDAGQKTAALDALGKLDSAVSVGGTAYRDYEIEAEGTRIVLRPNPAAMQERARQAVGQSIEIVRRRIDELGTREPMIARQGEDRIIVQLPGESDPGRIKALLGQTAKMSFHMVGDQTLRPGTPAPPGFQWLPMTDTGRGPSHIVIRRQAEVDGSHLTDARPTVDQRTGEWLVTFAFNDFGGRRFADITTRHVGKPFAIVLDGKVISAPVIREPIVGGRGQISGSFNAASANDLAVLLRAGALPAPLTVVEERTVGPDLGADAIRAGMISLTVGFGLVITYMAAAYGRFGLYANMALLVNLAMAIGALSAMGATLTLPGIAGLLLSLGMAVDANILINERIREETRRGKVPAGAIETGFRRAYATIVDANATTLIKMLLLYMVGVGAVRGFAVTISLGILISMFTAILLVRMLIVRWLRLRQPTELHPGRRLRFVPDDTRIAFMKGRNIGLGLSAALSLASVVLFFTPGLNYGVDFAGGTVVEIRTPEPADFGTLRTNLEKLGIGPVKLQHFGSDTDILVRLERQSGGDKAQAAVVETVQSALQSDIPGTIIRRVENIGASVSEELFRDGMLALGLAAIAMLLYIWFRFEWPFGVGAVATMLLDVTKVVGFFALTGIEFNLPAIAAILTVMGFSINDKVVVYDRVRENLRIYKAMPLRELIDLSINETLSRTVATSFSTLLAILPLALFGGESLQPFAWVLLFGIILATSSSIFIAAPILLYLGEERLRQPQDDGDNTSKKSTAYDLGGFVPSEERETTKT